MLGVVVWALPRFGLAWNVPVASSVHLLYVLNPFPSSLNICRQFETCIVYMYIYLLAVVFFPAFAEHCCVSCHITATCRSVEPCENIGWTVYGIHKCLCVNVRPHAALICASDLAISYDYFNPEKIWVRFHFFKWKSGTSSSTEITTRCARLLFHSTAMTQFPSSNHFHLL